MPDTALPPAPCPLPPDRRQRVLKLTLAYDGTRFVGWQRQAEPAIASPESRAPSSEPRRESIQGLLEDALARFEGGPVVVHGAGRTDAGVHALGQVASVQLSAAHDVASLTRGLNAQLPPDIRVLSVEEASADFHARFSARSKTYRYQIRNAPIVMPFERAYVWHIRGRLDVAAMRDAAAVIVGRHDFRSFQSAGTAVPNTVRTMTRSEVACDSSGLLTYEIAGDGFLRHMVRALAGTLVEIGFGWRPAGSMRDLLSEGAGGRAQAGRTAPALGLFLVRVDYH